jgi:GNAT superfamily N-acetyltransferase
MFAELGHREKRVLDAHDRAYRRWVRPRMRRGEFRAFVVEDARDRIVGSGAIWLEAQQPRPGRLAVPRLPYILSMYTEPAARGRGVATRLVREMIRWAMARGYPRIFLHASHMGRPVYERLGFEPGNEMRLELPVRRRPAP